MIIKHVNCISKSIFVSRYKLFLLKSHPLISLYSPDLIAEVIASLIKSLLCCHNSWVNVMVTPCRQISTPPRRRGRKGGLTLRKDCGMLNNQYSCNVLDTTGEKREMLFSKQMFQLHHLRDSLSTSQHFLLDTKNIQYSRCTLNEQTTKQKKTDFTVYFRLKLVVI